MKINLSIVIPTYKRKKFVMNLLNSLKNKVSTSTEVIIVEKGQNNSKQYFLIAKKNNLTLRYFNKNVHTSEAKNIGIIQSKGNYVVFFDDDVIIKASPELYLKKFKAENIAAINGRVPTIGHKDEPNNKEVGRVTFWGEFTDGYTSKIPQEIETVIGCNVCWRKSALQEINGFDENFSWFALREEADLSFRARKAGYKILFDPEVEVLHVRAESGGTRKTEGRIQWYFDFFSNETYFFLKHWPFWSVPLIILTRYEWAFRCMFGFGREVSLRSLATPFAGVLNGYQKFWRWKNENRN